MLKCVIIPSKGREISGILPNNKRISEETTMCLNKREILKCMKNGSVYGVRGDGTRVLLTDSESINKEIMDKVRERQSHDVNVESEQAQLLDIVGITDSERKEIENNVKPYSSNNKNKNQRYKNNKKQESKGL